MFKTSRGLAHNNRAFALPAMSPTALSIIGTGSLPVAAIRPANTATMAGTEGESTCETLATCCSVIIAVTLSLTFAATRLCISGRDEAPLVLQIGILTNTLSPHE